MSVAVPSAAIISIGDEVLRGDTVDTNRAFLGAQLTGRGVAVRLGLTIPDDQDAIIRHLRELAPAFDYVLVCGGIGPTPDDVTRPAVAKAMGRELVLNDEALRIYSQSSGRELNEGQREMCRLPDGCELIWPGYPVSPGFIVENVYVFPGVPQILIAMWEIVAARFSGTPQHVARFTTLIGESRWAHIMAEFITRYPALKFGSYPKLMERWFVEVVVRGAEQKLVDRAADKLKAAIEMTGDPA